VIVAIRIARRRAGWRHETHRSAPRGNVTAAASKGVSITVITNGRTAPA
jgi:hypothetical protein